MMVSRRIKVTLVISLCALLLVGALVYDYYGDSDYRNAFTQPDPPEQTSEAERIDENDYKSNIGANSNMVYILFLGIDKNDEGEEIGVYRTDTISVARMDLDKKNIQILSIPRDTYTFIPIENKLDKINHAYAFGSLEGKGPEESIKAVNHLLGQQIINYYFLIDMEPIPEIVDEIGGVLVDVDMSMKSGNMSLTKGLQVLNGVQAQFYLRYRNSPGGDIDRIKHQQQFMLALFKQQKASDKLLESIQVFMKNRDSVKTDLSLKQMTGLARFMTEVSGENVDYAIIPGKPKMINGVSYWLMNENETKQVLETFLN